MTKHHSCWGCKTKLAMFYTWCDFVFLNHLTLVNIVKEESTLNWLRATTCHHFIHLLFRFICTVICNLKNKQNVKVSFFRWPIPWWYCVVFHHFLSIYSMNHTSEANVTEDLQTLQVKAHINKLQKTVGVKARVYKKNLKVNTKQSALLHWIS